MVPNELDALVQNDAVQNVHNSKGCFDNYLKGEPLCCPLSEKEKDALFSRRPPNYPDHRQEVIYLHSESIRQISYILFWIMCLLAFIFSSAFIPPEIIENSDLMKMFGFNNVSFWLLLGIYVTLS